MTPERWKKLDALFHAALELEGEARAAHLAKVCGDDEQLRAEAERLIAAHERESSFIDSPIFAEAAALTDDGDESPVGRRIGPYQVISQLGRGGMGEVYLAEDTRLRRKVALKLLPAEFTRDAERVRRFEQEARAASALNHPNIVTIHEIGQVDATHYIVTEFVEGQTLRQQMTESKLGIGAALDVAAQVASALAAAHAAGIVHRDIKPENVMVRPDGLVKVLDFGLAKLTEPRRSSVDTDALATNQSLTEPGQVMGTPHYMSPEQARGLGVDARSDIFSLGVVLYEMIAGRRPFEGATTSDVIAAILTAEPAPLSQRRPDAPPELERIVSKALRKDRDERYQAVQNLSFDLKSLQRQIEAGANQQRIPCASCGHENPLGFAFCGKCGHTLSEPETQLLPGTLALPERTPQPATLSAPSEGERRQATVVWARLSGYAAMVEQLSPEEVEQIIKQIKEAAVAIIASHDGVLERFTDQELVALFGLPSSHEDDYLRAVRAGLAIHACVRELCADVEARVGEPVRMYTGISTGALVTQAQSSNSGNGDAR